MRTTLVTGAAGFIGSHLTEALLAKGDTVVAIDNMNPYYDPALKEARLAKFKDKVVFYRMDIADREALEEVFKKHTFDTVCHLAAQAGVRYSIENPYVYADSNYVGTQNILELSHRYGSPHVVMASSSSVYGANPKVPFEETDECNAPMSIYAASKRACELLSAAYHSLYKMDITALRFFTVYGPWGRPDMALFSFTERMMKDEPIELYNGGEMRRDFTYIDDIVQGFLLAIEKPQGFQIFNLGRGAPVHLKEFVSVLEGALGKKAQIIEKPMQMGDVPETYASVEKARTMLGFEPRVTVSEGVPRFVEWFKAYKAR